MTDEPQIIVDKPEVVAAHYGHICIAIPRADPDLAMIDNIRSAMSSLAKRSPSGIGLLFIVGAKSGTPNGPVRHAAGEMFDQLRPHLKVVSAHMEGSGFAAAAKRSVFTWATQHMLGKTPVKTFSRLSEATQFLYGKCQELKLQCPSSQDLSSLVRRVHDSVD